MNYCKVIVCGTIVDVTSTFLKWQKKHDVLLSTELSEAHFICSSDGGTIWRTEWLNRLPDGFESSSHFPVDTVEAVEITEEEYESLKAQLEAGKAVEETTEETTGETAEETAEETTGETTETVMSAVEMRVRIKELENVVATQTDQIASLIEKTNDLLVGSVLEM